MSETTTPARPASLDQIADARDYWASIGLDVGAFDAALAGNAPAAPPAPVGATAPAPNVGSPGGISLTTAQAEEMANALLAQGVPEARVAAALDADGYELADAMTPEQAEHDARYGFDTEHAPADYKINYADAIGAAPNGIDANDLAQLNHAATEFLAGLRIEPDLGASLVEHLMRTGQELRSMDDTSRALWLREQEFTSRSPAGSDDAYAERIRLAQVTLDAAGKGAFRDMILAGPARHDAWTVATLANFGSRLEAWKAGSKKTR